MLQRAKERYEKAMAERDASTAITKKVGRPCKPDPTSTTAEEPEQPRRSSTTPLNKELCVFCQQSTPEHLHELRTLKMGIKMKEAVENCSYDMLKIRLGSLLHEPDYAVAHDMK